MHVHLTSGNKRYEIRSQLYRVKDITAFDTLRHRQKREKDAQNNIIDTRGSADKHTNYGLDSTKAGRRSTASSRVQCCAVTDGFVLQVLFHLHQLIPVIQVTQAWLECFFHGLQILQFAMM